MSTNYIMKFCKDIGTEGNYNYWIKLMRLKHVNRTVVMRPWRDARNRVCCSAHGESVKFDFIQGFENPQITLDVQNDVELMFTFELS